MNTFIIRLIKAFGLSIFFLLNSCNGQKLSTLSDAKQLITDQNYEDALIMLTEIIDGNPKFDSAYLERGCLNLNLGYYKKANEDFIKFIDLKPNYFYGYYLNGLAISQLEFSMKENHEDAIKNLCVAIEINPKYIAAYVHRGNLFREIRKTDNALQDFNDALKIDSNYYDAYFNRTLLYKGNEDYVHALADFKKAIELEPENPFPYVNRGYMQMESFDEKEEACKDFKRAEELGLKIDDSIKKYCRR